MTYNINYIYSILCQRGSTNYRKVSPTGYPSHAVEELVNILIPGTCSAVQCSLLGELYIKFIKTDASLNKRLMKIDPYNSYDIVSYDIVQDVSTAVDLDSIAKNIKNMNISLSRYNDTIGYIMEGLEHLIYLCEEALDERTNKHK